MKYRIRHSTQYAYTDAVPLCQNQVRLAPRSLTFQDVSGFQLIISPEPEEITSRLDPFGNRVDSFAIHEAHKVLRIASTSEVNVRRHALDSAKATRSWEAVVQEVRTNRSRQYLDAYQFAFASPYVPVRSIFADYAAASFGPHTTVLDATINLTDRIHRDFEYDPTATTLSTPVEEVFESRRGVCQDFAHLQIACLRTLGVPAKYVSGYLRTIPPSGQPRLVGADASHAWLAVFCGDAGWIHFDPTNNLIPGCDHITIAWGRDYGDVCPVRGVFVGGGQHNLTITVDVEPLPEEE